MDIELLPCPFCGSHAVICAGGFGEMWVECGNDNCGASHGGSIWFTDKESAVKLWNRRVSERPDVRTVTAYESGYAKGLSDGQKKFEATPSADVKHTPLPWRIGNSQRRIAEQESEIRAGEKVLFSGNSNFYEQACIDAELVVKACNKHYELEAQAKKFEALKSWVDGLPDIEEHMPNYISVKELKSKMDELKKGGLVE